MISKKLPLMLMLCVANCVQAENNSTSVKIPENLLSTEQVTSLLQQSPDVAAARANLEVANKENGLLVRSPYEWTARATTQQRSVQDGSRYTEWNIGVERPIRLFNKANIDKDLGQTVVLESEAMYGEAIHEAARELAGLWVNWLTAENTLQLENRNLQSLENSFAAVEKRTRAGDASALELNLARAELIEQKRLTLEARTEALASYTRLTNRFPGFQQQASAIPDPIALVQESTYWKNRVLSESDELKLAELKVRKASVQAERLKAERVPDPTMGIFTASEVGGRERLVGVSLSMPIPTGLRNARAAKALSEVEVLKKELEMTKRQLETEVTTLLVTTQGMYDNYGFSYENVQAMERNAQLVQRAYSLGETDLQSLLIARRQAISANNNLLKARSTALKSYLELLVNAHLIWGLEHE